LEKIIGLSLRRPTCSEALRTVWFALLVTLWLIALPAFGQGTSNFESQHLQRLDEVAPDFLLRDSSGSTLHLSELRGHPVILHFWSTWCEPCRVELPTLETLAHQMTDSSVILVAVAIDTEADAARIRRYANDLGVSFPVYLAREGTISDRYWSWGVPVTYLIDPEGRLVSRALGPRNWASASMHTLIAQFAAPATLKSHDSIER
jgi:thiol-disulfide isomerase/thioredoxin